MQNVNRKLIPDAFLNPSFPICLAPMVGLTHAVQRKILQEYMPKNISTFWPTEMLNSRRLPDENLGKSSETYVIDNEPNLIPQILGNQKSAITKSIHRLKKEWNIVGVDINMGCPVQKALRHNYGVSLMGDAQYAADVVRFAVEARDELPQKIPISVKLRAVDSDESSGRLIDFVGELVHAGADWITLHPRTPSQQRRGQADWTQVKKLKNEFQIPIIGNGDIQIVSDIQQRLSETGADKIMIGRALIARPWMLSQWGQIKSLELSDLFSERPIPQNPEQEGAEFGRMLLRYIDLCEEHFKNTVGLSENLILRKILFFVRTTHVWLEFGHTLYGLTDKANSLSELREYVKNFFSLEQRMVQRTELRQ